MMFHKHSVMLVGVAVALGQSAAANTILGCANACESVGGSTGGGSQCNNSHYWFLEIDGNSGSTCTSTGPTGSTFSGGLCGQVSSGSPDVPGNWYNPWGSGLAGNCGGLQRGVKVWAQGSSLFYQAASGGPTLSCNTNANLNDGASESSGNKAFSCEIAINF